MRSMGAIAGSVAVLAVAGCLTADPGTAADRDCSDFDTQAEAQRFYDSQGPGDPHDLDGDGDAIACETNSCPCAKPGSDPNRSRGGGGGSGAATKARVAEIVDGDTLEVRARGRRRTVRVVGVDTPERGRCGYRQATSSLAGILRRGERVKLVRDRTQPGRDRYGRLLRYVQDGSTDAGRKQLLRGWARVLVVGSGFAREAGYRKAQRKAKRRERGIWSRCR